MIRPIIALAIAALLAATAANASSLQAVRGTCAQSSHTAEGPIGADLTKRQSRFFCDFAAVSFLDDYKGHTVIQFTQSQAQHIPPIGFAGRLDDDGVMMNVDKVYLNPNQATTVSVGFCKFFYRSRHISGIACGMKVDEVGRRTTAIIAFAAAAGQ